jgi:hypothetical protein
MRGKVGLGVLCNGIQMPFARNAFVAFHGNERYVLKLSMARLYPTEVKMQEHPVHFTRFATQRPEDYRRQKLQSIDGALIASLD